MRNIAAGTSSMPSRSGNSSSHTRTAATPTGDCASDMSPPIFAPIPSAGFFCLCSGNTIMATYEIICYSDVLKTDGMTDRLRACADGWQNIVGWTDEQVADKVREDKIDILVDLAGHTAGNRLRVFARSPRRSRSVTSDIREPRVCLKWIIV